MSSESNILVDQFGRKHDYLRLSLTERCNMRCTYCMPADGIVLRPKEEFMRTEEIFSIAQTFVKLGVKKIRLTGGEPLARKDAGAVIELLSTLLIELSISTNGILIDQHIERLKACGVKSVNVSLDSLNRKYIMSLVHRLWYVFENGNYQSLTTETIHGYYPRIDLFFRKTGRIMICTLYILRTRICQTPM